MIDMGSRVVWRLLRRNVSVGQFGGYAVANFVGLAIVLTAMQFYRDVEKVFGGDDSFMSRDYVIISKKVEGLGSILGGGTTFSPQEISDIEAQPWLKKVGAFTASDFNVSASLEFGGRGMSTALFLESIPKDFFDVLPKEWTYRPGESEFVPIMLNKDYLSLYNFGFATSHGMPQVSESMIGMFPIRLTLGGNGRLQSVPGRIVGFSSRLNTIAVPEEFMAWANSEFGDGSVSEPSRLILEVNSPGNPDIEKYLSDNGYESAGDRTDSGKASYFLSVLAAVVISVGVLISLLSFFILFLSVNLLLQKSEDKLSALMSLGYSPLKVARYYNRIVVCVNVPVFVGAVSVMLVGAGYWRNALSALGAEGTSVLPSVAVGVVLVALISIVNACVVNRMVKKSFFKS